MTLLGTGNMEQCLDISKRLFNESECRETFKNHCFSPLETNIQKIHPTEFYAFSTYYYTASLLRLSPGTPLNLKQSWAHAKRLCTVGLWCHEISEFFFYALYFVFLPI